MTRAPGPRARVVSAAVCCRLLRRELAHAGDLFRGAPRDATTPEARSQGRYRRIALTTATSLGRRVVEMVCGLVSVPLILSYLGKERYGLWAVITSVVTWMSLCDFGMVRGLVNAVSQANGQDDREAAGRHVSTAFVMLLGITAVVGLLFGLVVPWVPWEEVLGVKGAASEGLASWAVAAAMLSMLVGVPLSLTAQIYAGYQRTFLSDVFAVASAVATLGALILAVRLNSGMPLLILLFGGAGHVVTLTSLLYATRRDMPWLRLRLSKFSRQSLSRLTRTSVPLFILQVGALLVNESQLIILAHRADLGVVADYSVLLRVYLLVGSLVTLTTSAFVPTFREAAERGEHGWMRASFRRMLGLRMILASAGAAALVLGGNWLLRVWLRRSDMVFGADVWLALAVLTVAATWVTAFSDLLTIMDTLWVQVVMVAVNGAVTVGLTFWLAPKLGVLGVLLAVSAVTVLLWTWVVPVLSRPVLAPK